MSYFCITRIYWNSTCNICNVYDFITHKYWIIIDGFTILEDIFFVDKSSAELQISLHLFKLITSNLYWSLTGFKSLKVNLVLHCSLFIDMHLVAKDPLPASIHLNEDVFKTSFIFAFRRRLQDVLIKTNLLALLIRLQKTSSRRLDQDQYIRLDHTSSRRFQDVLQKLLKGIFKTSSRRFKKVFMTSSRHLQDVLQRCAQDTFKMYHQVILLFLTYFQDVSITYSQYLWGVLQSRLSTQKDLPHSHFWEMWSVCKICKSDNSFSSFSSLLY